MVKRFGQDYEWEPTRMIQKDDGPYVLYEDYWPLRSVTRRLLEAMRTGVQLSSKEMDEIEKLIGD